MTTPANYEAFGKEAVREVDLLNMQMATNTPQPTGLFSIVSDPLLPDRSVTDRLGHIDPEIYDLRDTSNFMKFLTALLGGAGVGGLRKQTSVARLNNAFATTHFLDLDRFYGALFGIARTNAEMMPDFGSLTDDSGTLVQAQDTSVLYSLHKDADFAAATSGTSGATSYVLSEEFEVVTPILVRSLRYWRSTANVTSNGMGIIDQKTGALVDQTTVVPSGPPAAPGWHATALPAPVLLGPGRYLVASWTNYYTFADHMFDAGGLVGVTATSGPVKLLSQADATDGKQSRFVVSTGLGATYPSTGSASGASYGVDLVYSAADDQPISGGRQFDPYTDAAGNDVWDDVHSRDAGYRARLIKFSKAIPQGGTYAGLLAAAEAILSVECQLYESWSWVDDTADHGGVVQATGYTWGQVAGAFKTWGAVARGHTWSTFAGRILMIGRTGTSNRAEVLIVPKRALRTDEQYELVRVLARLKPQGVSITVDPNGLAVHEQTAIRSVAADSEYWEVTSRVVPAKSTVSTTGASVYETAALGQAQPRPAFSQYTGEAWACNNDIQTVTSYELQGSVPLTASDYETVVYADGTHHSYTPSEALIPGAHAAAARAGSDGVLTGHPYCRPRSKPGRAIR